MESTLKPDEPQNDTPKTADRLAKEYGVSAPTIRRDARFARAVDKLKSHVPDIERRVLSGDISDKQRVIEAAATPEIATKILAERAGHVSHNSG
jgi:DeoR/GlpR family transcriptional regulator of sugar metabolism